MNLPFEIRTLKDYSIKDKEIAYGYWNITRLAIKLLYNLNQKHGEYCYTTVNTKLKSTRFVTRVQTQMWSAFVIRSWENLFYNITEFRCYGQPVSKPKVINHFI